MSLKIHDDVINNTEILVLPKVTDAGLLGIKAKIRETEFGALGRRCTVNNNKSIIAIRKRTHPGFNKLSRVLSGKAHVKALEGVSGGIVLPLLVVTTVARPALDNRALVVPNIDAKVVHTADESGVLVIGPLLVERLLAH